MIKYLPIFFYGAIIILVGFFLIISDYNTFNVINFRVGVIVTIGSVIAFIAAFSTQRKQVQFAYHQMHAFAMMVYGISILLFCKSMENFIDITAFLFIFYSFSEIIFCNWLFNLGKKVVYKIILVRFMLGLAIGIGTVVAMYYTVYTLESFGVLFIFIGINILLYVPVIKQREFGKELYVSY